MITDELEASVDLSLSPELQKSIEDRVTSGQYERVEDVLTAALVSLDQHERTLRLSPSELETMFPGLTAKLVEGLAAADQGKLSDGETFFDELDDEVIHNEKKDRRTA